MNTMNYYNDGTSFNERTNIISIGKKFVLSVSRTKPLKIKLTGNYKRARRWSWSKAHEFIQNYKKRKNIPSPGVTQWHEGYLEYHEGKIFR
jgi:hypothetical protein